MGATVHFTTIISVIIITIVDAEVRTENSPALRQWVRTQPMWFYPCRMRTSSLQLTKVYKAEMFTGWH